LGDKAGARCRCDWSRSRSYPIRIRRSTVIPFFAPSEDSGAVLFPILGVRVDGESVIAKSRPQQLSLFQQASCRWRRACAGLSYQVVARPEGVPWGQFAVTRPPLIEIRVPS
jgi:hypothetical protein